MWVRVCVCPYRRNGDGRGTAVWVSGRALREHFSVFGLGLLSADGLVLRLWGGHWAGPKPPAGEVSEACHVSRALGAWGAQNGLACRELTFWLRRWA